MNVVLSRHPKCSTLIFVNDPYDLEFSIKDAEHDLRSKVFLGGSKNVTVRSGQEFPSANEFNAALRNNANKLRIQAFLKNSLREFAKKQSQIKFIYSVRDKCYNLSAGSEIRMPEFEGEHFEADTIILYIYSQIRKLRMIKTVVIDAKYTDVIVLASYVSNHEKGTLGIRRGRSVFDCRKLFPNAVSEIIVQLHVHSGADAVSGFFGRSKKSIYDLSIKSPDNMKLLEPLGSRVPCKTSVVDSMVKYTLRCVYNDSKSTSLSESRSTKWNLMKRKNFRRLPPDIQISAILDFGGHIGKYDSRIDFFSSYLDSLTLKTYN